MKRILAIAGFLSIALMGILCPDAEAQYPGVYGHHDYGRGYDSYGHTRYDGHGDHAYGHYGYGHYDDRHAGHEHYGYVDARAGYGRDGHSRFGYEVPHHADVMHDNHAYDHGHSACPFALSAPHPGATFWQHGDHSHGNSFADPRGHADGMQRRSNPDFAVPNRPSQNRDNAYIPQPSLSQNAPAARGNASDAIVMDGPPPSLEGITPSSSGESSPSHDHAGHDHDHAGHDHAH
ncbi:hypothetical protein SH528x_007131 [Novipirellula sp. SH528]|uniref:hypothetical protein n=1 Tax=Novipirellula sp. SH528 TaxID=3454466 RepID=UPI003FA15A6A